MSTPVTTLRTTERIGRILTIINDESKAHNGFPVVEDYDPESFEGVSQQLGQNCSLGRGVVTELNCAQ